MSNWKELQARLNAYQAGTPDITEEGPDMIQLPVGRAGNPGRIGPVGPAVAPPPNTDEMLTPDEFVSPITMRDIMEAPVEHPGNQNYTDQAIREGYDQSRFDTRSGYTPGTNWEDRRAREQSAAGKILNGIAKGAVTAADTFLDTTLGTVFGAAYAFSPLSSLWGISPSESLEAFATNPVSEKINKVTRLAEDWFPNYRTEEEQSDDYQQEWYKPRNFFSANNIGDGILKNFGFTVGAMAGGLTWGKLLGFGKASQLSDDIMKGVSAAAEGDAEAANALKQLAPQVREGVTKANASQFAQNAKRIARRQDLLPMSQQLTGSLIAAAGEGKTEGLMARDEFLEDYLPRLQQETNEAYANAEQELLQNPNFQMRIYNPDDPTAEPEIMLNTDGQIALQKRQNEIFELFRRKQQEAYNQADDLATLTFALNIPILTGSNAIQFGRMLGGGWRSARQAAGRVRGRVRFENGAPVADYRGIGRAGVVARTIGNLGKLGGTEAAEEMLQGTVSSGAKQIADDRLTSFHDLGYDRDSMNNFRDAFSSFIQGGTDYLGDWKNWQEGALGALTGLLGMPGRGYFRGERGGIPAAIAEGREGVDKINETAQKLNDYVNSETFQNRYRNWIRHDALNAQVNRAAEEDNEYAYHTADDALLVNDIIMFSDAGRLDDLKMIANRFSRLSDDDIADARQMLSSESGEEMQETDEQVKERVEKQAAKLQQVIKDYTEVEENTRARLPMGASSDILKETVFTEMQMKNFENRFLTLLGETIDGLDPILYAKTDGNKTAAERKAEVVQMQQDYAQIFSGNLVPISEAKRKETTEKLNTLENLVKGNPEMEQKVRDMRKLSEDRQKFYEKAVTLQKTSPEEYAAQAKSQEKEQQKATEQARKQEAQTYATQLDATQGGTDTVEQMHRIYSSPDTNRGVFIDAMREKAKNSKQAKQFVDLYDVYHDFREAIAVKHPKVMDKSTGKMNYVADALLNQIFSSSDKPEEFVRALENPSFDRNSLNDTLQSMVASGAITDDQMFQPLVDSLVNATVAAVNDTAPDFISGWRGTSERGSLAGAKPEPKVEVSPDEDNLNPVPATAPVTTPQTSAVQQEEIKTEPVAENAAKPTEDNTPEPVERVSREESMSEANSSYQDNSLPEQQAFRQDGKGAVKYGYYQMTIPEIPTGAARTVRDLLLARKNASKEELRAIDETIAASDLSDFVVFDDDGKPVGGEVDFADTYKWLRDQGAFEYVSTQLNPDDEVIFAIMPDAPKHDGKKQIVVAAVKSRNADGTIEEVQPLTILHSSDKSSDYMNLDELYDAIYADYDSSEPEGSLYIFGGRQHPKSSKVWGKRPGLVRYDRSGSGSKRIDEIPSYDENAPIMVIGDNDQPILLRGNIDVSKIYMPNRYEWSPNAYGNLYYLVKSGDEGYSPIALDKELITRDLLSGAYDNPFLSAIRDRIEKIDSLTSSLTSGESLDKTNERLKTHLGQLNEYVNLDGISFEYVDENNPYLHMEYDSHGVSWQQDVHVGESILPLFDSVLSRPARLSPKEKWLKSSRQHLSDIIDSGLLSSNALELRQVGVNFMYDPWDVSTNTFSRVLPEQRATERPTPKPEQQVIAQDAELGGTPFDMEAAAPEVLTPVSEEPVSTLPQNLEDFFKSEGFEVEPANPEQMMDFSLSYDELDSAIQEELKRKNTSKEVWDNADETKRRHLYFC